MWLIGGMYVRGLTWLIGGFTLMADGFGRNLNLCNKDV